MYNPQVTYTRIKYILRKRKLKMNDLITAIGVQKDFFNHSANTLHGMSCGYLYEIACFLHVSTDYLLGLTDNLNDE